MTYTGIGEQSVTLKAMPFNLQVSRGKIAGMSTVEKFGRNADVDTGTDPEDVWTAGGIWAAPTQARAHTVASSSTLDTATGSELGARTVEVFGLTDWDSAETSETITMNGTSDVTTTKSYVIIHRMIQRTGGAINVGTISATAVTDATVTAEISIGAGQTQMAIYGLPSTHEFYITNWYMTMDRSTGAAASVDFDLLVKENADDADANFIVKNSHGLISTGGTHVNHIFPTLFKVAGPAIIKSHVGNVSASNTDVNSGFDGYLIDTTSAV